jgi:hypothetical protein
VHKLDQCSRNRLKEEASGHLEVVTVELFQLPRQSEHSVKVSDVRQPLAQLLTPLQLLRPLAQRTMSIAARTGYDLLCAAVLARHSLRAEHFLTALSYKIEHRVLSLTKSAGPPLTMLVEQLIDSGAIHCRNQSLGDNQSMPESVIHELH